ncbi:hypothetical protein B0H17DRAFT_346760 [Mycena rosella]|uniref:Uncharacterized protein n=1 Tax=Mycena rosella TaxID=1033263 RepID=A0AAD7CQN7_MYCRO|nr:hypothetical protein B0H17DRAFT_346760 [Mycena rosella]
MLPTYLPRMAPKSSWRIPGCSEYADWFYLDSSQRALDMNVLKSDSSRRINLLGSRWNLIFSPQLQSQNWPLLSLYEIHCGNISQWPPRRLIFTWRKYILPDLHVLQARVPEVSRVATATRVASPTSKYTSGISSRSDLGVAQHCPRLKSNVVGILVVSTSTDRLFPEPEKAGAQSTGRFSRLKISDLSPKGFYFWVRFWIRMESLLDRCFNWEGLCLSC